MADTAEAVRKSVRTYLFVGGILFLGTILTYLVATVPQFDVGRHGFDVKDAIFGFSIAAVKATLVAAVFMHLNHEKKAVYWIFGTGIVFVIALFGLTALAKNDPIHDTQFYGQETKAPSPMASPTLR